MLAKRQCDLTVVLENIEDPHNMFAVLRTCDAVGISEIYTIKTKIVRRRKFGKKSSSGAIKWVRIHHFESLEECMEAVKSKYEKIYASLLGEHSTDMHQLDFCQSCALVFGNEKEGITEEMLKYCNGTFLIPQVGMIQSLNISVACAVTLYEAFRQRNESGLYKVPRSTPLQKKSILAFWNIEE